MGVMDTLSSAEFRKTYARLTRPTVVTVNGHPIGTWTPGVSVAHQRPRPGSAEDAADAVTPPPAGSRMTQAERDAILRRISHT